MKKVVLILIVLFLGGGVSLHAQNGITPINVDASTHGDTIDVSNATVYLYDNGGGQGNYVGGHDYWVHVIGNCESVDSNYHLTVVIDDYDILFCDTLYVYDGPDTNAPCVIKLNNDTTTNENGSFTISPTNTSKMLTIRFRTIVSGPPEDQGQTTHRGFHCEFPCRRACEKVEAFIDSVYQRPDKEGNVLSTHRMRLVPDQRDTVFVLDSVIVYDTVWQDSVTFSVVPRDSVFKTDSIIRIDTVSWVDAALLCQGQGIIFHGHGTYTNNTGWYTPHDSTSLFQWNFTIDTLTERGATSVFFNKFKEVDCYDITLAIEDENGCPSNNLPKIQVRLAQNPIKTIYDLTPVCSADSLKVSVGYDGDNGTLTLKKIEQSTRKSKTNRVRTFIPDGRACGIECYEAPVTFNEFGSKKVNSAGDICSICVNYEHSFMGDYELAILCPTYDNAITNSPGRAILKTKELPPAPFPASCGQGGGTFTGVPYLVNGTDGGADGMQNNDECDSTCNPYGLGFNYCFSRNENYTLVTGHPCDASPIPQESGIGSHQYISSYTYNQPAIPAGYYHAGQNAGSVTVNTKDSSDHENMTNYYMPASDFSELAGCPLNGTWQIQICDKWKIDNGWVFSWTLDVCGVSAGGGCSYQVGIDSVVWAPDTNRITDFRDGIYRGLRINKKSNDNTIAYISSPDTSGDFVINLHIYDEFGCRWDTTTRISTVYTPTPHLGNDTVLCGVNTITLDATDEHTTPGISTFRWEPTGDTASRIQTIGGIYKSTAYVVQAINTDKGTSCPARDTIIVDINEQPVPSFDPGIYPLEGCEPFTINIDNTTKFGDKYRWVFGDGSYSTLRSPSHSYAAGSYDLKYYVESDKGCKDSLIFINLITVHPSPQAKFHWDPVFPNTEHPTVTLINNTTPDNGNNKYFWEIQYDKDMPYSFHTITEKSPTFEWRASSADQDIAGSYAVRLIARSDNRGPSGQLIQCADTVESNIIIINDHLKFPSVVTPNGDGINDVFIIENLVEGLAFPINTLDIYDKWGSRVFHATNISQKDQFWDPAKNNTPAGSYFYRFSGKGYKGNVEHNGVIEVVK